MHIYPFKTVLKDATLAITSIRSRHIKNDIDTIDAKWATTGKRTPMERHYRQDMIQ